MRVREILELPSQASEFITMVDDVPTHCDVALVVRSGEVPADLDCLFAAGGWFRARRPRIEHLLDAYPCLVTFRVHHGSAVARVRPIADRLSARELRAGRILRRGLFTSRRWLPLRVDAPARTTPHDCIGWNGKLFVVSHADWFVIEPRTLEATSDRVLETMRARMGALTMLSVHPQVDSGSGRLVTLTFEFTARLGTRFSFIELDEHGHERARRRYEHPGMLSVHAFSHTANYYVLPDRQLRFPGATFLPGSPAGVMRRIVGNPHGGVRIHVVPRDPAASDAFVAKFALPGFIYHVLNSFEDDEGRVVVDAFVSNLNPEHESSQFELDRARPVYANLGAVYRFVIDARRKTASKRLLLSAPSRITFETIDEARRGRPYRNAFFAANDQVESGTSHLWRADVDSGETERWSFGPGSYLRQPRVLAGVRSSGDWVIVPIYTPAETQLAIFAADRIAAGPVALLGAGRRLPYMNHAWAGSL